MKNHRLLGTIVIALLALPIFSLQLAAQQNTPRHRKYKLIEIGTFGGPNSVFNVFSRIGRNDGTVVGAANTDVPDPNAPACFDFETCFVQHAWKWQNGVITDLGVLPGGYSSYTNAINSRGLIVGQSENGEFDPLTGAPTFVATVWDHGNIRNLGTFGGGFSIAIAANDQNFVMGAAENGLIDHSGMPGFDGVSQIRAFGWSGGDIFDLGTLGGEDAFPGDMNTLGQVVGASTTTLFQNSDGIIPVHPFLWSKGKMRDLGTLGGNFCGSGAINNRGQVAGTCSLPGDQTAHPFLWQGGKMSDLGTIGGSYAVGEWINEAGDVIGFGPRAGDDVLIYAFLWHNGTMTDLGTVPGDNASHAFGINNRQQVVGQSWFFDGQNTTQSHAFLWEKGGPMIDLNTLVSPSADLNLFEADFITDRGEIVARGFTPNGDVHTAILSPAGEGSETASTVAPSLFSLSSDQSARLMREVLQRLKKSMLKGLPPGRSR
jgi:probable HAF family extracellular repeat protein